MFGVGFAAAFVSAFLCVRWLMRYVSHHDFIPFAWYRIAFGASSWNRLRPAGCVGTERASEACVGPEGRRRPRGHAMA